MLTGRTFAAAIGREESQPATLPELLRNAGYATWHVGKWHAAGKPTTRGFVESRALFSESAKDPRPILKVDARGIAVTGYRGWVFQDDAGNEFPEQGVGLTPAISERFADAAIELLKRKTERPFFLQLNFTSPHDPRLVPAGYEKIYPPGSVPPPANFQVTPAIALKTRDERLLPRPLVRTDIEEELAAYYAQISHMDAQIGRVLDALTAAGKAENTIIVFISDNGLALGSHGLVGKQNLYDHSLLVPCIIAGPGVPRGVVQDAQIYLRDISASVLAFSGIPIPSGWDSSSLLPLIRGEATEINPFLVGYYLDESRSVRNREWKLIDHVKTGVVQLFNLRDDPLEMNNLAADPKHARKVDELRAQLQEWASRHPLPGRNVRD